MNAPLHTPWTQERFLAWAGHQEGRYEFDGAQPVAMTGGTVDHGFIMHNLHAALRDRLRGSSYRVLGPDMGVVTINGAVRYPDALVTCWKLPGTARTVAGVKVLFEITSPSSMRTDWIVKTQEYAAISSVCSYVIIDSARISLTRFDRAEAGQPWTEETLSGDEALVLAAIGVTIPVGSLYDGVEFEDDAASG